MIDAVNSSAAGGLPASWARLAFDEAIEPVSDGGRRIAQRDYLASGAFPIVDQGESPVAGFTNDEEKLYQGHLPVVIFGDHTRRVKFIDFKFAVGAQGVKLLRPRDFLIPKFLAFALTVAPVPSRGYSRHFQFLRKTLLPIPPLLEQTRIVAEIETQFTRLDAAVAAVESAQAKLKRYRASVLKTACEGRLVPTEAELARSEGRDYEPAKVLVERILRGKAEAGGTRLPVNEPTSRSGLPEGWTWATLGTIAEVKGGITKGQRRKPGVPLRAVPYLRVANVQRGFLDLAEMKSIDATEHEIEQMRLLPGDVLFTEGGDRDKLGRGWVWDGEIADCIHQNHVFRVRLHSPRPEPRFISWYGNSLGQDYFMREGKQTTNLASINMTKLRAFPVAIPPASEQSRIVEEVDRRLSIIDALELAVARTTARSVRLRSSILKTAFEGQLVPQDPNDEPASVLLERIRSEREQEDANARPARKPRARSKGK